METLRIMTPYPLVTRRSCAAATVGGYAIPAGATLHVSYQSILHDPREFHQPLLFRPARWLAPRAPGANADVACEVNRAAFGLGCRHCSACVPASVSCIAPRPPANLPEASTPRAGSTTRRSRCSSRSSRCTAATRSG